MSSRFMSKKRNFPLFTSSKLLLLLLFLSTFQLEFFLLFFLFTFSNQQNNQHFLLLLNFIFNVKLHGLSICFLIISILFGGCILYYFILLLATLRFVPKYIFYSRHYWICNDVIVSWFCSCFFYPLKTFLMFSTSEHFVVWTQLT